MRCFIDPGGGQVLKSVAGIRFMKDNGQKWRMKPREDSRRWRAAMEEWRRGWICHSCSDAQICFLMLFSKVGRRLSPAETQMYAHRGPCEVVGLCAHAFGCTCVHARARLNSYSWKSPSVFVCGCESMLVWQICECCHAGVIPTLSVRPWVVTVFLPFWRPSSLASLQSENIIGHFFLISRSVNPLSNSFFES